MIRLLFVGDGKRDAATVPRLVEQILGTSVQEDTRVWARLHGAGRGYEAKLLYALRQARDQNVGGVVATLDSDEDKPRRRLRRLKDAREADRERSPPIPTALGEAVPHGEAWLLDDPVAVREGMRLPGDTEVPGVRSTKNPKSALTRLMALSPRENDETLLVWADVARRVDPARCTHSKKTGFHTFVEEVRSELGAISHD